MIRVVIVDDQAVVRAGVARILGPEDGFDVVAECEDGDEVPDAVAEHGPDVVLMDVRMRRVDGVAATRALAATEAAPPVLVLTTFDDDDVLWGALEAGAAGFVLKDASAEELIAATRAVAGGGAWLDPDVTGRVLGRVRGARPAAPAGGTRKVPALTAREHPDRVHAARVRRRDVQQAAAAGADHEHAVAGVDAGAGGGGGGGGPRPTARGRSPR